MLPNKIDITVLSVTDNELLNTVALRRITLNAYIAQHTIPACTCPSCGFATLTHRGHYELCDVCDWEDDNQDDATAHEVWGGPNSNLSLTESRILISKELAMLAHTLNGVIMSNPVAIFTVLNNHKTRMINFKAANKTQNNDMGSPYWEAFKQEQQKVKTDLIIINK
ncbi:MAG: CPCC family cysteine-rich protein [Bacteroidia bacterium]